MARMNTRFQGRQHQQKGLISLIFIVIETEFTEIILVMTDVRAEPEDLQMPHDGYRRGYSSFIAKSRGYNNSRRYIEGQLIMHTEVIADN